MFNSNRLWVELSTENNDFSNNLANIYLFQFDKKTLKKSCEICSMLTIKMSERYESCFSGVVIDKF